MLDEIHTTNSGMSYDKFFLRISKGLKNILVKKIK